MARQGRGPQQRPVKGFRPGKEPPHLRKQIARQQMGDMNAAQERLIEVFSSRSPAAGRALVRRWRLGMLAGGLLLLVLGALLYGWSVVAGVLVHVLAVAALVIAWQLNRQKAGLDAMADALGTGGTGRGKKGR